MTESNFDLELEALERASVGRLLAADVFDLQAFEKLQLYLNDKSERIKAEHVISKQFANCVLRAARLVESRADDMSIVRANSHIANDFRRLLDIVAAGESWNDYKPGVPRVR